MNSSAPQGQKEEQPQIVEVVPDCQQTNQQVSLTLHLFFPQ